MRHYSHNIIFTACKLSLFALTLVCHISYGAPVNKSTNSSLDSSKAGVMGKQGITQAWDMPEKALFFKADENTDWYKVPSQEREWLQVGSLSRNLFIALDPKDANLITRRGEYDVVDTPEEKTLRQKQVRDDWSQLIKPDWLPAQEIITIATLNKKSGIQEQVAHCAFLHRGYRGIYSSTHGRNYWIYIEQPEPLPDIGKALTVSDIIRPENYESTRDADGEKYPRVGIQSREFIRYRAHLPGGPYERVRILLIHCRLPRLLNFQTFGYPGRNY